MFNRCLKQHTSSFFFLFLYFLGGNPSNPPAHHVIGNELSASTLVIQILEKSKILLHHHFISFTFTSLIFLLLELIFSFDYEFLDIQFHAKEQILINISIIWKGKMIIKIWHTFAWCFNFRQGEPCQSLISSIKTKGQRFPNCSHD